MKSPLFVTGEPALLAARTLFVADIHIGIEHEYRLSGLNMPSQTEKLLSRIESLLKRTRAVKLVLIGDIKHKVPGISWQEEREIPAFLSRLAEKAEVHVVPGNHDGKIDEFVPKGVRLHRMAGDLFGKAIYASHGHTWPEPSFLQAKYLVISHSHPQVEFRDRLGYTWRERVWIRAGLDRKRLSEKYAKSFEGGISLEGARAPSVSRSAFFPRILPELIVMSAFNPLSGGIPVNRKREPRGYERKKEGGTAYAISGSTFSPERSPILKSAKMRTAKIYMLDGTYLGELGKI